MTTLLLCERAAIALFDSIWHAALLLAVVAIALRLLPRLTAAVRSLIWTAALILVAALPFVPIHAAQTFAQTLSHANPIRLSATWSLAIAALWIAATTFRAIQLIAGAIRLRHIRAAAIPLELTAQVKLPFGLRRAATLCLSDDVVRPSVLGFFSPRILVPTALYPRLSSAEIDHIVLHEMEHLRRLDDWRNLLQKLAVTLFPLNPALLWIERRLCFERELACDESVLAHTHAPKSYAACLVHLAEERTLGRQLSLALGAWERRSELGRRIHDILANRTPASARIRTACASTVTAGMIALALLLAKTPQLLTFTAAPDAVASTAAEPIPTPGSFHSAQPRMVNTSYRIPAPAPAPIKLKAIHRRAPRPRQIAFADPAPRQQQQPRIVLASWTYSNGTQTVRVQRLFAVYEVSNGTQSSTETAPNPGSLFILQL